MKKIILAISILATMASAYTQVYGDGTFVYGESPVKLTNYFDGNWYACRSTTRDNNGRIIKKENPHSVITITYDDLLNVKKVHTKFDDKTEYVNEQYEVNVDGRKEIRKTVFRNGKLSPSDCATTVDHKGCPVSMYNIHTGKVIVEYRNDSLCHPLDNVDGAGTISRYAYDNGRLVSVIRQFSNNTQEYAFDESGDLIKDFDDYMHVLKSYSKDDSGRIVKIRTHIWYTDKAVKKYAYTSQTIEEYFKYFVKGNTTYKCHVDKNGYPVDRAYDLYNYTAQSMIEDDNGLWWYVD